LLEISPDTFFITLAVGYLLGSIPFGLLLTRFTGRGDIQKIGSGNIGATNVLRSGSKLLAFLTLLFDGTKGALAIAIGQAIDPAAGVIGGGAAILGHLFPVWLRFHGGKGVSTTLGVLLMLSPMVGVLACAIWLLIAFLFRYSSLAALVAIGTAPISSFIFEDLQLAVFASVAAAFVFLHHHENIYRLIRGIEPKIGAASHSDS